MKIVVWKHLWKYVWVKKYVKIREMLFKNWKWLFENTNQTPPKFDIFSQSRNLSFSILRKNMSLCVNTKTTQILLSKYWVFGYRMHECLKCFLFLFFVGWALVEWYCSWYCEQSPILPFSYLVSTPKPPILLPC